MERKMEGEHDKGDICPVLVFRENDGGPMRRDSILASYFNPVKYGKNSAGNTSCD
jgi:hypothetical protein